MVFIYVGISRFFGSASAQCMALSVSSPLSSKDSVDCVKS